MGKRFFLDTNVFVYTFDRNSAKQKKAAQLIHQAADTGEAVVSYQVVQEFFNVALRRFPTPMGLAEAEQYLVTVFRPLLAIHSSSSLYLEAMRIVDRHHFSWYDSLIVAAAREAKCDTLYTEDLSHGQTVAGVRVENPFL